MSAVGPPGTWETPSSPSRARRYRRAKSQSKRSGKGDGESERPIVPTKQGQPPERPCGGKGAPSHGIVWRKDDGDIVLRNSLNETRTDSEAGETDAGRGADHARA